MLIMPNFRETIHYVDLQLIRASCSAKAYERNGSLEIGTKEQPTMTQEKNATNNSKLFGQRSKSSSTSLFWSAYCFLDVQKYFDHNPRQLELTHMVVQDFIIDMALPFSIVDHLSFLRAMNTIDPRFTVLSRFQSDFNRQTHWISFRRQFFSLGCSAKAYERNGSLEIGETLPCALERVMMKVKQACADAKFVALTLDAWSDRRMRALIGITMHTIGQKDGTFQNCVLTFQPISGEFLRDRMIPHRMCLF